VVLGPDLTPGDFVRAVKQLMDLLGQVAVAAGRDEPVSKAARAAVDALRRGVVTYSSVEDFPDGDIEDFPAEDAGQPAEDAGQPAEGAGQPAENVGQPVSGPPDLPDGTERGTLPA
jgi:hypothetical protein